MNGLLLQLPVMELFLCQPQTLVHFAGAIGQKVVVVMPGEQGPWHLGLKRYRIHGL